MRVTEFVAQNKQNFSSMFLSISGIVAVGCAVFIASGARITALFVIAILMGAVLAASRFSFSAAYRNMFTKRQFGGVQAQLILLLLTSILFFPLLKEGVFLSNPLGGAFAPLAVSGAIGAMIFGIGMQLAGACASGSLYSAASGNPRMLLVLLFFCAGSFWASLDMGFWASLPQVPSLSLAAEIGWSTALSAQIFIVLTLLFLSAWAGKHASSGRGLTALSVGKALVIGAVFLALLNMATLMIAGHPWTITWGFTLVGAKTALLLGWDPSASAFWSSPFQAQALANGFWHDITTMMNIGILMGAGSFAFVLKNSRNQMSFQWRPIAAAILGGLMLGYGARLAYGCNIGAMVSGIASSSLHGWLWLIFALLGNWIGVKARPYFKLQN
jgi:uncharacterized membrane protein YedE/YeeE